MGVPGGLERLSLPGAGDVCLAWASASALPEDDAWLTPAEATILDRFRVTKRAADWRLGRWVGKEAVARALRAGPDDAAGRRGGRGDELVVPAPSEIEILAGPGGGPRARILTPGDWAPVSVSLSHSSGTGFAAATARTVRIGCDVEEIAPRSGEFVSDYFTAEEVAWIRARGDEHASTPEHHVRSNLLWSAKESALKAVGEGLRKDTRSVVVDVEGLDAANLGGAGDAWRPLRLTSADGSRFDGWWRVADGLVWMVVGQG
ncbi:MAG TPA: 4'-phosphopantetheinyl transferase superfamily protein [Longimicrobiales bacterium]|nr:4'-phosphopantetheinyl transferase superfamily protein [Longimicrobiales bacterium]